MFFSSCRYSAPAHLQGEVLSIISMVEAVMITASFVAFDALYRATVAAFAGASFVTMAALAAVAIAALAPITRWRAWVVATAAGSQL